MGRHFLLESKLFVMMGFLLILFACKDQPQEKKFEEAANTPQEIKSNSDLSVFSKTTADGIPYSYTLPPSSSSKVPVVFFFDPAGNGRACLEQYKNLSKELGWVLICSNYHHNNIDPASALKGWVSIKKDVLGTLPVDSLRMLAGGFSGGARQAISFLAAGEAFRGIIGNSAGFPMIPEVMSKYFAFYGLYGNADMNLSEMENLDQALSKTNFLYHVHSFQGNHAWAPYKEMRKALVWMAGLQPMQNNIPPETVLQYLGNEYQKSSFEKIADQQYLMSRAKLTGSQCEECVTKIKNIEQSDESRNEIAERKKWRQFEERSLKEIQSNMGRLDMNAWKVKIDAWSADTMGQSEKALANKRILGYLSLLCYTAGNKELENESARAGYIAQLYTLCDPENAEAWILLSRFYARSSPKGLAIQAIEKAIAKGAAKEKIMAYPELKILQ
jgi:hypothetical protein